MGKINRISVNLAQFSVFTNTVGISNIEKKNTYSVSLEVIGLHYNRRCEFHMSSHLVLLSDDSVKVSDSKNSLVLSKY